MTQQLGSKHACVKCGVKFYDLNKYPCTCPKCGKQQPNEETSASSIIAPMIREKAAMSNSSHSQKDVMVRISADDIPEVDDDDEDAVEEITHSDHHELPEHNDDDADDEYILESMGEERAGRSIVTTIAEAEEEEERE